VSTFALAWLGKRDVYAILAELYASPEWQAFELKGML
jgi:hypothetical protein